MSLHTKLDRLTSLAPDLAIVPESAAPVELRKRALGFSCSGHEWEGARSLKGLGVLAFGALSLARHTSWDPRFPVFIPVEVHGAVRVNLLAVWAFQRGARPSACPNPDTTLDALEHYSPFLRAAPSIVAGDFNASVVWDSKRKGGRRTVRGRRRGPESARTNIGVSHDARRGLRPGGGSDLPAPSRPNEALPLPLRVHPRPALPVGNGQCREALRLAEP